MSRPLRIQYENAVYHVMNRGLGRQRIFLFDDDYGMFIEALKETSLLFGIRVIAYALMPNHYHLLIQTPRANLSRAMRHLNGVYTQRFNKVHKTDGPLFRGRFKSILVQEDEYLTYLIRYIHLNPVQANLTDDLLRYPHTSHKAYLGGKDLIVKDKGPWLYVNLGLSFFSHKPKEALRQYLFFIRDGIDPKTKAFYKHKKQNPIFGDPDFIDRIKEQYLSHGQTLTSEIPDHRVLHAPGIAKTIIQATTKDFKVAEDVLFQSKRGQTNLPRLVAISLTWELSGYKLSQIAELFKLNSYKNTAMSVYRMKSTLQKDSNLNKRYNHLRQLCKASSQLET